MKAASRGPTPQAGANHLLEASPHLTDRRPLVPLRDTVPRPASSPRAAAPPGAGTSCGRPRPPHTDQRRFPPRVRSPAHPAEDLLSPQSWELPGFTALNSHLDTPNLKFVRIHPSESLRHMSHAARWIGPPPRLLPGLLGPEPIPEHRDRHSSSWAKRGGEKRKAGGFPGGPVAETVCSQCRRPRIDPCSGKWIPHAATKTHPAQPNK